MEKKLVEKENKQEDKWGLEKKGERTNTWVN